MIASDPYAAFTIAGELGVFPRGALIDNGPAHAFREPNPLSVNLSAGLLKAG